MFISKGHRSPFYQLTYEVNGKRTTISTKTSNLNEAYKFMATFNPLEIKKVPKLRFITLSKFIDEYADYIEKTKSKNYKRSVEFSLKILLKSVGDIQLQRFDVKTADGFLNETYTRTPKGTSIYYRTLKAAFSKAVLWNYIEDNPFKKIKLPRVAKTFPVFITESELEKILEQTKEEYLKDLFLVAFYTGMRLGELVNMKWSWVDLQQNQITVKCSDTFTTKSKKERIIPFNQNLKNIFAKRNSKRIDLNNNEYVISNVKGIRMNEDFVSKKFKESVKKAKLDERIHFHSCRHGFASALVSKGVSLYVVKELLGHESLSTSLIYSHLQQQSLIEAVNLL